LYIMIFLCFLYFSCGSYLSGLPSGKIAIHALVVSQDGLPDILAVGLHSERVGASAILYL